MTNSKKLTLFCKNVRFLRKHHNLSQKEMAKRLHIGVYSLKKIENDIIPPRLGFDILFYFYPNFSISPEQILSADLSKNI